MDKLYEIVDGIATKYIFAGNLRIAKKTASSTHYFHKDHLGSSSVMTDAAGLAVETTEYMPYGETRKHTGTEVSNYKFTDQELDPESGLYNYDARMYDPMIGRFISTDTIVPRPFDPQSLNRYSYCLNNPLIYVDPTGHEPDEDSGDWGGYSDAEGGWGIDSDSDMEDQGTTDVAGSGGGWGGGGWDGNQGAAIDNNEGIISWQNDEPNKKNPNPSDLTNKTKSMVEEVVVKNEKRVNVNSGYRPNDTPRHGSRQAVDINRVDGKPVSDPTNLDNVRDLQEAFIMHPNTRENFGPALNTKTLSNGQRVDRPDQEDDHKDHIHISGQE